MNLFILHGKFNQKSAKIGIYIYSSVALIYNIIIKTLGRERKRSERNKLFVVHNNLIIYFLMAVCTPFAYNNN